MHLRQILLLSAFCALMATGCQCCRSFDTYAAAVDHVADRNGNANCWYSPKYDLTRIGKPDWCGTAPSWLCPCRCQEEGCYTPPKGCQPYPQSGPSYYPNDAVQRGLTRQLQASPTGGSGTTYGIPPEPGPAGAVRMPGSGAANEIPPAPPVEPAI